MKPWRPGPFAWGTIAGATLTVIAPLAIWGLLEAWIPDLTQPEFNVDVASLGADVTRHGGVRIEVVNAYGSVAQTCNDACDDLHLQESSGDNAYAVRVLNATGGCVACGESVYVTNGYGASVTRFRVEGREGLHVRTFLGDERTAP